ncbi:hypothetical protein BOO88_10700 [Stutzerimonas stutzeri]|nr:hypothetical protein BOO89_08190 [Stutzerimonas stutzeri]AZO89372.1 hypothetical protein BOO88_10700 [Stutzerimonas stutzeri]
MIKTRTVRASGFFIINLKSMLPVRPPSRASPLPQGFALITRSSHTTDHCGSNISALADQTSEQAQNSALLIEELTKTANTQYSLVERFNR